MVDVGKRWISLADAESFDAFYRSTYDRTLRYLYGMLGDRAEAQDVTQEAFGRAWRSWRRVSDMADPEAWVRTVGWRIAANHLRHLRVAARRHLQRPIPVDAAPPDVDNMALIAALRRIDPAQRQALVLHYLLDLPMQQVADESGVSLSAAKARVLRGRAAVAALLDIAEETSGVGRT